MGVTCFPQVFEVLSLHDPAHCFWMEMKKTGVKRAARGNRLESKT
jgi:hypothetical protein